MATVTDLEKEREVKALVDRLGKMIVDNPTCTDRTAAFLRGELDMQDAGSLMISVRLPRSMVATIDEIAREIAYKEKRKLTRSALLAEWLSANIESYKRQKGKETAQ